MPTGPGSSGATSAQLQPGLTGHIRERIREQRWLASDILPYLNVTKVSDEFLKVPAAADLQVPTSIKRAEGSGYEQIDSALEKDFYATEDEGVEQPVDDRRRRRYEDQISLDLDAANRASDTVSLVHEKAVKDLVHDTAVWTGADNFLSVTNEWDDYANATPAPDLITAKTKIYNKCGASANMLTLQLSYASAMDIVQTDHFRERRNTNEMLGSDFDEGVLARYFGVGRVIVGYASENTANTGLAETVTSVWDDEYAFLYLPHSAFTTEGGAGLGRTFVWDGNGGIIIEKYRDERVRGDVFRARHDVDRKLFGTEFGFLLGNIRS